MKGDLEKFIVENRGHFDDREPSEKVWPAVKARIYRKKNSFQWIWKAAAIVFFLTSLFLYFRGNVETRAQLLAQKEKISSDFKDVESFYFELITEKRSLIASFEDKVDIDHGYEQDMQNLDAMYEVLKDELRTNPSKKVVDALLLNLVVRIDILNKKLAELEEDGPEGKKSAKSDLEI